MVEPVPSVPTLTRYERAGGEDFAAWRFEGITIRRVAAYAIDFVIVGILLLIAGAIGVVLTVLTLGLLGPLLGFLSFAVVLVGYTTLLVGGPKSATWGMQLMGIEMRRVDGGRPDYLLVAVSTVVFYVLNLATSLLILLVGLFNSRGRLVHDFLCGTVVVRTDPVLER